MTRSTQAYDFYGREIKRNAVVTYPVRQGSFMWLDHGKVTEVNNDGSLSIIKPQNGRAATIRNTNTTILATKSVRQTVNEQLRQVA